jgi:hypothetical protein
MSALRYSLKLIPPLPTGGIAKTVRPAVVGYIFSDLLPGNLALSWVTAGELTDGFLEKSNLSGGQLRQSWSKSITNSRRCHPIQAFSPWLPCAWSKYGTALAKSTLPRKIYLDDGFPCMTYQLASTGPGSHLWRLDDALLALLPTIEEGWSGTTRVLGLQALAQASSVVA